MKDRGKTLENIYHHHRVLSGKIEQQQISFGLLTKVQEDDAIVYVTGVDILSVFVTIN